ncbi:MAG: hypothetical protein V2A76_13845 [Planctomycetota bacterium]
MTTRRESLRNALLLEESRLAELESETEEVRSRIEKLRSELRSETDEIPVPARPGSGQDPAIPSSAAEKVALFGLLFLGRQDVFPLRWENRRTGKSGYSPACANEWVEGVCAKKARAMSGRGARSCGDCSNQNFLPASATELLKHLQGRQVMGVYPLFPDETCRLLAVDFDKKGWQQDVTAFAETCRELDLPVAIERSRSGDGAHAWFFFSAEVPAVLARKMGCLLITRTMDRRHELSLDSYDRLFPSQDTLPRGGFGNLIALPLQLEARKEGNTEFLDQDLVPHVDQWRYLAQIRRIDPAEVRRLAEEAGQQHQVLAVRETWTDDEQGHLPWKKRGSSASHMERLGQPMPARVNAVLAQKLFVEKAGLPSLLLNRIKRLATFQNPEFYKRQGMRLSTALTPHVITCAEDLPRHIALPRGCADDARALLESHGSNLEVKDERVAGQEVSFSFEHVLSEVKAKYLLGLTATPERRDGLHPILRMQLGPVRFSISPRSEAASGRFELQLVVRETGFRPVDLDHDAGIQTVYAALAADEARNQLIFDDVLMSLENGRSPILLTERRDHLDRLAERFKGFVRELVVLHGGLKAAERRAAIERLLTIPTEQERLVLATGRYLGEGFDDARLDTLFLALPVAWKGTLVQYAGRLLRPHPGKRVVQVHDYVDRDLPVLARMFEKRLRGFRGMGYGVASSDG